MPTSPNARGGARSSRKDDVSSLGNAPHTAYQAAKAEWAERMGTPIVEKNRWFLVATLLAVCLLIALIGYTHLLPLKTVEPFIVEVDKLTGEARSSAMRAQSYNPQEREIRFFTARWARQLLEIGPATPDALQIAYSYTRGTAIEEFKELLKKTNVFAEMKSDSSLRRTAEISSITFVQERVALIRLVTTTRSTTRASEEKRFILNINFEIDPPKEEAKFLDNPIGLYITHFDFREELK